MFQNIEYQSQREIKLLQETKLKEALDYLSRKSPFYHRMFDSHSINIHRINTLEDLRQISFTMKVDLQQYNEQFMCVPKSQIIDYITTSGTLGNPAYSW